MGVSQEYQEFETSPIYTGMSHVSIFETASVGHPFQAVIL